MSAQDKLLQAIEDMLSLAPSVTAATDLFGCYTCSRLLPSSKFPTRELEKSGNIKNCMLCIDVFSTMMDGLSSEEKTAMNLPVLKPDKQEATTKPVRSLLDGPETCEMGTQADDDFGLVICPHCQLPGGDCETATMRRCTNCHEEYYCLKDCVT